MNRPAALDALLPADDGAALGSVQATPIMKLVRPATFGLWAVLTFAQAATLLTGGSSNIMLLLLLSTVLFVGVHIQFWYEESTQGQRLHQAMDKMRGSIYEDDITGLPNSRHFVFELRRQMMRSVRNGRGFSLILADLQGMTKDEVPRALPAISKVMRHATAEGDFLAHLEGTVFGAIVVDDHNLGVTEKAETFADALNTVIPADRRGRIHPIVSLTGYQGELEVRDFLRRSQRDLVNARSRSNSEPSPRSGRSSSYSAA